MTSHVFGAKSSACVASYAIRCAIDEAENKGQIDPDAAELGRRNFYVDDFLASADSTDDAIRIAHQVTDAVKSGGFRLTKWLSNDRKVIDSFPPEERAEAVKEMTIDDTLPYERTLGLMLDVEKDVFRFDTNIKEKPTTRRGILSMASSVFDPLGFLCPVFLHPKLLLQRLTREKYDWDTVIDEAASAAWSKWFSKLQHLTNIEIPRCITHGLESIASTELHFFSDASQVAYAAVTYVKFSDSTGNFKVSLLTAKARVAPVATIPRLELSAAVLSARMYQMLTKELSLNEPSLYFWTDSMCVLRYIQNTRSKYKIFVANRLEIIHDATPVERWFYVPTHKNPADAASRGLNPDDTKRIAAFLQGPDFLKEEKYPNYEKPATQPTEEELDEVKVPDLLVATTQDETGHQIILKICQRYSTLYRCTRAVAILCKFVSFLKHKNATLITVDDMQRARMKIIIDHQKRHFKDEKDSLKVGELKASSRIRKLVPILDDGLLRVSGGLQNSWLPEKTKHPIILDPRDHVVNLMIDDVHTSNGHVGSMHILHKLRENYWIISGLSAVKKRISKCIVKEPENPS